MDSVTETALLDQSRVTPQLVLIAILLARPALNIPVNVLHVNLAAATSSTSNVWTLAQWELTLSMVLVNIVPTTVNHVWDLTLPALVVLLARSSTMELVSILVPT